MTNDWVIFDADNTLWALEPVYDRARLRLCALLEEEIGADPYAVERFQRIRDAELFRFLGYDPARFPQSFTDTAERFLNLRDRRLHSGGMPKLVRDARDIAREVFDTKVPTFPGVGEVLEELRDKDIELGLITGGDPLIQKNRLNDFEFLSMFGKEHIEIVPRKTRDIISAYCKNRDINIPRSWMVGDSLRSDIIPAREVGLQAVFVQHPNWHEVEVEKLHLPSGVYAVGDIRDVVGVIDAHDSPASMLVN